VLADTLGRRVTADGVAGVAVGLDADGALLVDDGAGIRRVVSGEIAIESGGDHAPGR
jgi:biotin-(acetyl-CoA carboxylase) ligase